MAAANSYLDFQLETLNSQPSTSWLIHISGIVQGVGFRPRVYQLARRRGLRGEVSNGPEGVKVRFQAEVDMAEEFYREVLREKPPLAHITEHRLQRTEPATFDGFTIVASEAVGPRRLLFTPDYALCDACRAEMRDPQDRRHGYAFITCTQCGPRYSIIRDLPYDRPLTTMADFPLCPTCQAEYDDPLRRRHFSQTNSCPDCGITLRLYDRQQELLQGRDVAPFIQAVVQRWQRGEVIAVKGIGGYLLTCDARSAEAVATLRQRKQRPFKPLAVMYPRLSDLGAFSLSPDESEALQSPVAPIVLLRPAAGLDLAPGLAEELNAVGVMLPYAPLLQRLLDAWGGPIVATSGNLSHAPIAFRPAEGQALLSIADAVLSHERPIVLPQDDSVFRFAPQSRQRLILRRSRGLAPTYFAGAQPPPERSALAAGADLKACLGLTHQGNLYLSQYLGDLSHYDSQQNYQRTAEHLQRVLQAEPEVLLHDLHPGYHSHRLARAWAEARGLPTRGVQHHEAHFAAVLGENALLIQPEPVLGVVWDGTGYGHDGQIWGGEFFRYQAGELRRLAHLDYFPVLAGDKMAREPRLSAFALLPEAAAVQAAFSPVEQQLYRQLRGKAQLQTSSMGRLFDAVAALLGLRQRQTYEGEAAMVLEATAARYLRHQSAQPYPGLGLVPQLLMQRLQEDLAAGAGVGHLAARFHLTLVQWVAEVAEQHGLSRIAFSGGVFQNALLVDLLIERLTPRFQLYFHQQLSPNDENIAFGQLMHWGSEFEMWDS